VNYFDTIKDANQKQTDLLIKDDIIKELNLINKSISKFIELKIFNSIESTNESLRHDLTNSLVQIDDKVIIYTAEHQTQGKGRGKNKKWESPYGENLYISFAWKVPPVMLKKISSLSIKLSQIIIELLLDYKLSNINLKWPNDIYVNNKKISGILIDIVKLNNDEYVLISGIGLNVNMTENEILQNTSIKSALRLNNNLNRTLVLTNLIEKVVAVCSKNNYSIDFIKLKEYNILNYNKAIDKSIKLIINNKEYIAKYLNITSHGALEVLIDGEIKKIYSVDKLIL